MKKKIRVGMLCALFLILIGVGVLVVIEWPRPTIVEMGTPITLNQEENLETSGIFNSFYRPFSWNEGSCEFTLIDAVVCSSPEEAGIETEDIVDTAVLTGDDVEFLLLTIRVKNIDATNIVDSGNSEDFNIGFISLLPENYFLGLGVFNTSAGIDHGEISQEYDPNMVYFSHHAVMQEGDRTNPYFHFKLKPGESAEYKIGYFARQDFIDNEQMMLSYGINKYASEIEVVK